MRHPRSSTNRSWTLDLPELRSPRMELSEPGQAEPVLRCSGELDGAIVPRLRALLDVAYYREIEGLLLDFSDVCLIDAQVLSVIEDTRVRLWHRGAELRIVAGGQPLTLLRLTGLDQRVTTIAWHRLQPWPDRSSSSSSPISTSGRPGAATTR
jgi:anti-anti-sigma factor